jgi:hypothetical protein
MAELVRSHDAGIVVERLDAGSVIAAIRAANHDQLREGTGRLRTHLLNHNASAIERIASVIDRAFAGSSHTRNTHDR